MLSTSDLVYLGVSRITHRIFCTHDRSSLVFNASRLLTKDVTWKISNLDGFNDLLHGGFGVHELGEPITIIWNNANKSKMDLGYNAIIRYYESMLTRCHPTNIDNINLILESAKKAKGETLFDVITEIINEHDDIEFILK